MTTAEIALDPVPPYLPLETNVALTERWTRAFAGRGHEVWQEINGVDHPLDDRVEARAAAAARRTDMKELSK